MAQILGSRADPCALPSYPSALATQSSLAITAVREKEQCQRELVVVTEYVGALTAQITGLRAQLRNVMRPLAELHAAHKVEMDALEGAQQAAAMAACEEDMSPCTMCKKALAEDDQLNCSECERVYCSDCGYGRGDFPRQCVDCDEFNCCKGIVVTHCHGGMVCAHPLRSGFTLPRTQRDLKRSVVACIGPGEECVQNHKSGGNRGKRKGFTPDGCTCLLDSDDY